MVDLTKIISVSIVEDDPVIREQLALLINESEDIGCVSVFANAEDAMIGLVQEPHQVVLMDIGLPGMSGIELVKRIKPEMDKTDFLMLTVSEDDQHVFNSICAGATGYLLKETPSEHILKAIREVKKGGAPMSAGIARKVVMSFREPNQSETMLSARELEVLNMLCDGLNYRVIAQKLFVSGHTVRAHIKNIYKKLHVHSRAEAVKSAIRQKLI